MQLIGFFKTVRTLSVHQQAQSPFPLTPLIYVNHNAKLNVQSVKTGYQSKGRVDCSAVNLVFSTARSDFRQG